MKLTIRILLLSFVTLAHTQAENIDPKVAEIVRQALQQKEQLNKKKKVKATQNKITSTKKRLQSDGVLILAGLICSVANFIGPTKCKEGFFKLGIIGVSAGTILGIRDYTKLQSQQQLLEHIHEHE